ncbi:uncharacterized protein C8Q71DRAFT_154926 [Rhodofomes roseus]|uniref:Uncharacterized protein n=1 Tax=Rhodofomes roseus TaxID=34475 RepID=A0ABQ8K9Z6_9APHY|nr:uncharacterized protein C8Q71DRAFT_154926 [Rhodofomes roseus]KAH9833979.1 hypothetical protein C8Q71DRAFT_154926 [Rhodofomes roseus]
MQREIYMNIPAQNPQHTPSFEERRVQDYLRAYQSTGRPPAPCPTQPTDRAQRAALGLPPYIESYSEVVRGSTDTAMNGGLLPPSITITINDVAAAMPDVHAFRPVPLPDEGTGTSRGAYFHCIVCQPEFRAWSIEELRVSAYAKGRKHAPEAAIPRPTTPQPAPVLLSTNGYPVENFQSISCKPDYNKHSLEELRLAFYGAGRQLTSAEIIQRSAALRIAKP